VIGVPTAAGVGPVTPVNGGGVGGAPVGPPLNGRVEGAAIQGGRNDVNRSRAPIRDRRFDWRVVRSVEAFRWRHGCADRQ
jgi:hypothetical protein